MRVKTKCMGPSFRVWRGASVAPALCSTCDTNQTITTVRKLTFRCSMVMNDGLSHVLLSEGVQRGFEGVRGCPEGGSEATDRGPLSSRRGPEAERAEGPPPGGREFRAPSSWSASLQARLPLVGSPQGDPPPGS